VVAKDLRNKIDLFVFVFILFTFASIFLLAHMLLTGEDLSSSGDPGNGLFGWMTPVADRPPLELHVAIVVALLALQMHGRDELL